MTALPYLRNTFRRLDNTTLEQVWRWRNLPEIRANMHCDHLISWQEHVHWFSQLQADKNKVFLVLWQNDRPVGTLYFTQRHSGSYEWGCYLGEQNVWPGTGLLLEIAALDYCFLSGNAATLRAEVLSFNTKVIKLHQIFCYQQHGRMRGVGMRDNVSYDVVVFEYQREAWLQNRETVLTSLPKQIVRAAAELTFL